MTKSDSELFLEPPLHRALNLASRLRPHPLQPVIGHLSCMRPLPKTQQNTAQRQRLHSRNIAGDRTPASHSLLFTEAQTSPQKLSQTP